MQIISISGPSGVGKTTLAKIIAVGFPTDYVTVLSGDAFHRWVRSSKNWDKFTHLHPEANNLKRAAEVLSALKAGNTAMVSPYNHTTGKFDKAQALRARNQGLVIYEGLHAFYDPESAALADVKIYVDTDPQLTREWKMARDISARGYTQEEVEIQLERRKKDQKLFIDVQKKIADVVVKFVKAPNGVVKLEVLRGTLQGIPQVFDAFDEFLRIANGLSTDLSLVQGAGGNFSVKHKSKFFIKASGAKIADVTAEEGFVVCERKDKGYRLDEEGYEKFVKDSLVHGVKRPSMEVGFHSLIDKKVVVHTHPLYLNAVLCSKESKKLIAELFKNYTYVEYVAPGHALYNEFLDKKSGSIWFLENHGLVVAASSGEKALKVTNTINNKCRRWLEKHKENIAEHGHPKPDPLFPDAVVYPKELSSINDFVLGLIVSSGLQPKFLDQYEQAEILCLTAEKYRKKL